eukprot:12885979-Prorocentrum_lima.AAC.1
MARFDILHAVAQAHHVEESNPINLASKIIQAFCVPTSLYNTLFAPTDGQIPCTLGQIEAMKT